MFFIHFFFKDYVVFLLPKDQKSILYWKEYLFNIVFALMIFLNSISFVFSSIRLVSTGNYMALAGSIVLFAFAAFILFFRRIPFAVRSYIGCTIFYVLGLSLLYRFGPLASGLFWFFLFCIFTASFNGIRGVVYSNSLVGITIVVFLVLIPRYDFDWIHVAEDFYTSDSWILSGMTLFFINLVSSISVAFYMSYLEKAITKNSDSRNAIIFGLASLTEFRDNDTGKHLERISKYSMLIAEKLRHTKKYRDYITENYIDDLEISSILHDIGKVGIEDKILLKKGRLTKDEFEKIKLHPIIGSKVIDSINNKMKDKSFLKLAHQIILYHHEKYDGSGYPKGLKGSKIPLSARIVALADVYDALVSKRVYKDAISHEEAVKIILSEKGKHFDPDIINVFLKNHTEFLNINRHPNA